MSNKVKLTALQVRTIETFKKTLPDLSTISLEEGGDQSEPIKFHLIHSALKEEG